MLVSSVNNSSVESLFYLYQQVFYFNCFFGTTKMALWAYMFYLLNGLVLLPILPMSVIDDF
jgi:hypothetical protein